MEYVSYKTEMRRKPNAEDDWVGGHDDFLVVCSFCQFWYACWPVAHYHCWELIWKYRLRMRCLSLLPNSFSLET